MMSPEQPPYRVLVLAGGPDRERPVSLRSGACVAEALRQAGHTVIQRDITPHDLAALDEPFDLVFPVLHGPFGEGGPLQRILEDRGLCFVGSASRSARNAIDKFITKQRADQLNIPTPAYQQLGPSARLTLHPPLVLKPLTEGSSFNVAICRTGEQVERARAQLHAHHAILLAERYIAGRELTVGIVDDRALPLIEILPAAEFYDFDAKYDRSDTRYAFDPHLPPDLAERLAADALKLYEGLDCRHLGRVDFIVDDAGDRWMLEINTMPGFTDHSLLPKAAARAGMSMAVLCDRLVRSALQTR